jgi:hypothetical protein
MAVRYQVVNAEFQSWKKLENTNNKQMQTGRCAGEDFIST